MHPARKFSSLLFPFTVVPVAVVLALAWGHDPGARRAHALVERLPEDVGAQRCATCHPDQHKSWRATYHATMTQAPDGARVRGAFDDEPREHAGLSWTPFRRDGSFFFALPEREAEVSLLVGSHVYQQYFERIEQGASSTYRRLPFLWHIEERTWMPVGRVFLHPGDEDLDAHAAVWNENCIFCHNTRPRPRMQADLTRAGGGLDPGRSFASRVSELGIACEACHGTGGEHIARHGNPLERFAARFADVEDETIVHPGRLAQEREVSVCGQCHAQRLPSPRERITAYLTDGPSFRPGELLRDHVEPVRADTPSILPHDPDFFRRRFWNDGTPRLTAYEYQGVTASPCYEAGALRCDSCHRMHSASDGGGVDPRGQLEPSLPGDRMCTQCHADIEVELERHSGHALESPGSRCVACHMPRIVYGLAGIRRSHRIESPDPRRDIESGRPHACTLCHLDRDGSWAAAEMTRIYGRRFAAPRSRPDGAPLDVPAGVASLLSGDVLQRAVAAWHYGAAEAALAPRAKSFLLAHLIVTLGDGYPAIRYLARRSLARLAEELGLDWKGELSEAALFTDGESRREAIETLLSRLAERQDLFAAPAPATLLGEDLHLDLDRLRTLLELQSSRAISIGE